MRTSEAVSPLVSAGHIVASLVMFLLIYLALFILFLYLLDQKIRHGPLADDLEMAYHPK
jgi:cytochrome d ubiquinol oxidase subunit I